MSQHTSFLSKLVGLYMILVATSMLSHKQATVDAVFAALHNPSLMLILGVITTGAGLSMVLAHNIWKGSPLAITVTLVGWMSLAKGLAFLYLPPDREAGFFMNQLHYAQFFYLYMAICLGLGSWFIWGGFASQSGKALR